MTRMRNNYNRSYKSSNQDNRKKKDDFFYFQTYILYKYVIHNKHNINVYIYANFLKP